ncbi:DUF3445 domain-containing protein [Rhizobium sp. KVB221]|uniref:DUF3445 domain-containing protein n=1 Tax=Rhizobium setariae TaxID=2801340 RepID=A0A936YP70_9HYPH|nr:DUF3445 domain-containing protein [Rhizobium setariae]MBL0371719.1 DUF3445 domain-containing protein [Rhizobium setariae]
MTSAPKHTPYDTNLKPFSIGLSALDPDGWIEPDDDLEAFLAEKDRLAATHFDEIFYSEEQSLPAQQECLDLIVDHLTSKHADRYVRSGDRMAFLDREVDLADPGTVPIQKAAALVQDDLVILEKREAGWHLVAAHLAFPSGWTLREKAGLPMEGVHAHVPGFEGGTRNATMLNRIFDNLQPDLPAVRFNWSIYPAGELFWPPERSAHANKAKFTPATNFIRIERQTLRRLPVTGGIVFTIRIYNDPISLVTSLDDDGRMANALAAKLMEFTPEQLAYKGMLSKRDALVDHLRHAVSFAGV